MGQNWTPMKIISALCFIVTSLALTIIFTKRPVVIKTSGPVIIGILLILVSVLTIISWFYVNVTGHEAALTILPIWNLFLSALTRMSLLSAFIFLSTGIIIILLAFEDRITANIAHLLFIPSVIAIYMIPVSYLLNVTSIHQFLNVPVALNTGIAFCAVCTAVYIMRPDTLFMRVFISKFSGGIMARRLFPWLVLFPVVIAWMRIYGEHSGFFVSEVGVLLVAITYTFSFVFLVWFTARSVNLIDMRRHTTDEALKKSYDELENKVRQRTSELLNLNKILDLEITERIKAEKLVEAERQRINGLLELMPAYIILLTPDYHVSYSNRFFREQFGKAHGKRCFEFLFNRTEPCEICETYEVLKDNNPHTWEWTGPDGHYYSIYDFPYIDSDGSKLIMEMGIDVTSLKKAEANLVTLNAELEQRISERTSELLITNKQLRASQKMAKLGSWELDPTKDVLNWSDEVYNIFGVTPEEFNASYKGFLDFIFPEDVEKVNKAYQSSINEGMDHYEIEHRILKKNTGEIRYLYEKCNHIRNSDGEIIKSLGMVHDITERKMMELSLQRNNERLDILSQTSSYLLESENPEELMNSLCLRVMKFLDCQVFFNFLTDEIKGKLHLNSYAGIPAKTARKIEWLDYGAAVCGCVARDGIRIVAENIFETPDPRTDLVKSFGIKAYACHPLLTHDKVLGTLSFGTSSRTRFSQDELSMMKTLADQVSLAMTRVKDKDTLQKSEERYRSLMELSPLASFVNKNNRIILLNSAARELLGVNSVEDVLGRSPFEFFQPDCHDKMKTRIDKILKGESVPLAVEQIVRADGVIRDVEVVATGINDTDELAIQVIMNDITERRLAEKELFDTKNYLENLIDFANAPIIVWDQENKIRRFNHAFEHLTGYTSSEVEGKKLDLLFPKDTLKESMRKIKRALTENWETIEIPILTKNEAIRIVLWNSAKIYDEIRKTFSTIAQGNDITERIEAERAFKASKEKLEIALENGKIGTWEWDIITDIFNLDERMEIMFGREPGKFENTYGAFEKSIHEEDLAHFRHAIHKALKEDIPLDTIYRIKHINNEVNYISTKALVEKDNEGNPIKMSGVCFDITEMKLGAEKALFSLNEDLLRSNKELEQFAYVASHDLQEPLRTISSFTQLLSQRYKDKLDQDANEFIQFAVDGAIRMQSLINGLLDYSRIETKGKKFSVVDMHEVLGQVVNNLNLKIQEKIALVTNDELPEVVADSGQMVQLLQNLIGNALKFCKSSPRIHISAREEREHFLFSIKDNGIGIEDQYYNRIFQIFQRLHPREEYGGTGIGLAICKRIVERHGGKIWVESKPGKGSLFYFTIIKR